VLVGLKKIIIIKDRLKYLILWTLEERRNCCDLLEVFTFFRMFKGLSLTPFNNSFTLKFSTHLLTHEVSAKIAQNQCRLDLRLLFPKQR